VETVLIQLKIKWTSLMGNEGETLVCEQLARYKHRHDYIRAFKKKYGYALKRKNWFIVIIRQSKMNHRLFRIQNEELLKAS
jgi:hypothetical protein